MVSDLTFVYNKIKKKDDKKLKTQTFCLHLHISRYTRLGSQFNLILGKKTILFVATAVGR